jgi:GT2 family glycosyltransferase
MGSLLTVYSERQDLQAAFPEVKNGNYDRLIEWAVRCGTTIDGQKNLLLMYKDWYRSQLPKHSMRKVGLPELAITGIRIIREEGLKSFIQKAVEKITEQDLTARSLVRSPSHMRSHTLRPCSPEQYSLWMSLNQPSHKKLENMRAETERFSYRPLVSICMSTYNSSRAYLSKALVSVQSQIYENWELIIIDDGASSPDIRALLTSFSEKDKRIHLILNDINQGAPAAHNQALAKAKGDYVVILDHDDLLEHHALFSLVSYINKDGKGLDLIYSDEALIDEHDRVTYIKFRPDFSPDFLLSHQYFNHMVAIKRSIVEQIGGYDEKFPSISYDYDLYLRVVAVTTKIGHIPEVLYRWRRYETSTSHQRKGMVMEQSKIALSKAMKMMNIEGSVEDGLRFNFFRVRRKLKDESLSIIILSKNVYLLERCLRSIEAKTKYNNYEIIVVANNIDTDVAKEYLEQIAAKYSNRCRIMHYDKPFNFSEMNNYAASVSKGQHLLFLNDDTEVLEDESIEAMLEHSQREDVGAVGAKLLYPDNTVQHAGVIVGLFNSCEHIHKHSQATDSGYYGSLIAIRNFSAVTAACIMVPRKVFEKVGGFDKELGTVLNDIDLCLRIRKLGYLIVYTPYAVLYHYEHATRKGLLPLHPHNEDILFKQRWKDLIIKGDPYYNPNLSRRHFDCRPHL